MAYQPEVTNYDVGVYQLEVADPVRGGVGGVDNAPLLSLANRTNYLKSICDALQVAVTGLAPINGPVFTGSPTAPTAAPSNNSLSIANTAFVQRAMTGTTSLTGLTGGTVTLTADQAALANLSLAGTLTSNLVINIPPAQVGLVRVNNATTGAFTVMIKTTTGSGVVIGQGLYTFLFNDGTNIVDGFTGASGASFGGAVTLANNVGLQWKDATGVARQVGLMYSTGDTFFGDIGNTQSGKGLYLSANATIAASINGTNVAFVTATGLGVGVAPLYRLHAYVAGANSEIRATAGTAGDAIVSAEATGVMVGQMAMRRASGLMEFNVGGVASATLKNDGTMTLGAVSRADSLNVAGGAYFLKTGGATVRLGDQYNSVSVVGYPDSSLSASHMDLYASGAAAMRLRSDGKVLIGTTTAAGYRLSVQASSAMSGIQVSSPGGYPQFVGTDGNVTQFVGATSGSGTSAIAYGGTYSNHAYALQIGSNEQWRLTANGNIAHGGSESAISGYRSMAINGSSGAFIDLQTGGAMTGRLAGQSAALIIDSMGARPILFNINTVEVARFGSGGGFAVNAIETVASITTGRSEGLRILGDASFLSGYNSAGSTRTGYLSFNTGSNVTLGAENGAGINLAVGGAVAATITTAGNVGIGVTSIGARRLVIGGTQYPDTVIRSNVTTGSVGSSTLYFGNATADGLGWVTYDHAVSSLAFGTVGVSRMALSSSGNLTVAGNVATNVSGAIDTNVAANISGITNLAIGSNNSGNTNPYGAPTGSNYLACSAAWPLVFITSATVRMQITAAGVIQDAAGNELGYKGIPIAATWTNGQCWPVTSGQTVPMQFAGFTGSIFNNSGTAIVLTQGSGLTLRQVGTTNTGNRTLAPYGYATIWYPSSGVGVISGGGLS